MAAHRKTRIGRSLGFVALFACLAGPAVAQTFRCLPHVRVRATGGSGHRRRQRARRLRSNRRRRQIRSPIHSPPCSARATTAGVLTHDQRAIVERVNSYLSGVQTLTGNFVQVGPDGSRTQGDFFISKPGRVRFEYDDPSPIELIADGSSVVVRDRRLATQDVYPLSQTPLRFLLADHVDLMKDTHLVCGLCRRRVRHRRGRGKKRHRRHQPADDHVQRQGHAAQAVDRDRPAGLRHHRRCVQSRHQQAARSRHCSRSITRATIIDVRLPFARLPSKTGLTRPSIPLA